MSHQQALASIVGAAYCHEGAELQPHLSDWRGRYHGAAQCAVFPANTAEVAAVVRYCHAHHLPMVPQGGNTGLCGGATPDTTGNAVIIKLNRLNTIRQIDSYNKTMTLEAGTTLAATQAAAEAAGMLFPLALASEGSCQIGGNLSTNAGGVQVLRYGNTRELTLGLEVVLPNGEIWDGLRGLRKDNTGYDLKQLFIGAEGTLGVITAAVLKLFPKPTASVTAWLSVPSPQAAIDLLEALQTAVGDALTAYELISDISLALVLQHIPNSRPPVENAGPWAVLCELSSAHESRAQLQQRIECVLATQANANNLSDGVIAQNQAQADALWSLRENISEAQRLEGFSVKHDIAVPISRIPEFIATAEQELNIAYPGVRIVAFGHAGDGNLHYNLSHPASSEDRGRAFLSHQHDINRRVHDLVTRLNGSISAEHGIGQLKRNEITRYKQRVEIDLMRSIKAALDPLNLMNPGKVLNFEG